MVREVMLADHHLDVYTEVIGMAENFNDAADTLVSVCRELQELDIDNHAVEIFERLELAWSSTYAIDRSSFDGRNFHAFGNFNPLLDTLIRRDDIVAAFFDAKLADHGDVSAAEDTNDFALCPALATATAGDLDEGAVTVHAFGGFGRREKDVTLNSGDGLIWNKKAKTIAMNREAASQIFGVATDGDKMTGAKFDKLAFFAEPVKGVFERIAVLSLQAQFLDQLLVRGTGVRKAADMIEKSGVRERLRG
jgi:hypothetical protein